MKHIFILFLFVLNLYSVTLNYNPDSDKIHYFSEADREMANNYKYFNKLMVFGDIVKAKKVAEEMFLKSRSINYKNDFGKMLSEIAYAKILKEIGEERRANFIINSSLLKFKDLKCIDKSFLYFDLYEFNVKDNIEHRIYFKLMKTLNTYSNRRASHYFKNIEDFNLLRYSFLKHALKQEVDKKKKKKRRSDLESSIFGMFGKNSPEYLRFLFYDAKIYVGSNKPDVAISSLNLLKDNLIKLLDDSNLSKENNSFLGDVYYELGNAYSLTKDEVNIEENYNKAINIYSNADIYNRIIKTYSSFIYNLKFINIKKAFIYAKDAEDYILSKKNNKSEDYAFIKTKISDLYFYNEEYKKSLSELYIAKDIYIDLYGEYSNNVKMIDLNIKYIEKTIEDLRWGI